RTCVLPLVSATSYMVRDRGALHRVRDDTDFVTTRSFLRRSWQQRATMARRSLSRAAHGVRDDTYYAITRAFGTTALLRPRVHDGDEGSSSITDTLHRSAVRC